MIDGVVIKQLNKFEDSRGWLVETFRVDELPGGLAPMMSYVSMTLPGVHRGPHEHREQTDIFVFIGPGTFDLYLWDNRQDSKTFGVHETYSFGEGNMAAVIVPPGIVHGYKNSGAKEAWCLNYPDRLYAGPGKKDQVDEVRHEENPESEFKIN